MDKGASGDRLDGLAWFDKERNLPEEVDGLAVGADPDLGPEDFCGLGLSLGGVECETDEVLSVFEFDEIDEVVVVEMGSVPICVYKCQYRNKV